MQDLGELPGGFDQSLGFGISGDGSTVVGTSHALPGSYQPFYWSPTTGPLNTSLSNTNGNDQHRSVLWAAKITIP